MKNARVQSQGINYMCDVQLMHNSLMSTHKVIKVLITSQFMQTITKFHPGLEKLIDLIIFYFT